MGGGAAAGRTGAWRRGAAVALSGGLALAASPSPARAAEPGPPPSPAQDYQRHDGYGRPRAWDEVPPRAYERPGEVPGYARARPLAAGAACVARGGVTCETTRPAYEGAACACALGGGRPPARGRVERW